MSAEERRASPTQWAARWRRRGRREADRHGAGVGAGTKGPRQLGTKSQWTGFPTTTTAWQSISSGRTDRSASFRFSTLPDWARWDETVSRVPDATNVDTVGSRDWNVRTCERKSLRTVVDRLLWWSWSLTLEIPSSSRFVVSACSAVFHQWYGSWSMGWFL